MLMVIQVKIEEYTSYIKKSSETIQKLPGLIDLKRGSTDQNTYL